MSSATAISARQLTALQTLWSAYARASLDVEGDSRAERLYWFSRNAGREITSSKQLTSEEARQLIDTLKLSLGQQPRPARRPRNRQRAHAAGTEGRAAASSNVDTPVGPEDLARITGALTRLGWGEDQFRAWLRAPSSPLRGREQVRTVGDANCVWWALKKMIRRKGLWN